MTEHDENTLSERQIKALPFFAGCSTFEEGCREAKVSKNTFYEWLKQPLFKAELTRLRDEIVADAITSLKSRVSKAVDVLGRLLDQNDNPSLLRGVANDIIGHVIKFKELQEIEQRLDSIERRMND